MFQSCWIPLILENAMIFCFPPLMSIFLPPSYNTPYCKHYQNNFSRNIPTLWSIKIWLILSIVAIQELNCVQLFEIPWTTFQVPLSSTISQSLLKFMSIELVMLSRCKAFSTCASHLTVITFFYAPATYLYMRPNSSYSPEQDKQVSLFYNVFTALLNPVVYSLR